MGTKFCKALFNKFITEEIPFWTVNHINKVQVDSKSFSIYIFDQLKIFVRGIRYHPWHRLQGIKCSLWFYGINNLSYGINNQCIGILRIIISIKSVPNF